MKPASQIILPDIPSIENTSQSIGSIVITGRLCSNKSSDNESYQKEVESTPKVVNKWGFDLNLSSSLMSPKTTSSSTWMLNKGTNGLVYSTLGNEV